MACSSASRGGGVTNGNSATLSMPMLFICSTVPSMGTRQISGSENASK